MDVVQLPEGIQAVELRHARAGASVHLRETQHDRTLCHRPALGAEALPNFSERPFDPADPDARLCRQCLKKVRTEPEL